MKIALLIQKADRRIGGAEGYTLDLARSLAGHGHQVTVIAEEGPAAVAEEALEAGYKCLYVGANGRSRWSRMQDFLKRTREIHEHGAYDIVHAMLPVWRCDVYHPHAGLAADMLLRGHLKHPRRVVQRWARIFNAWNPKRRGLVRIERELMKARPWVLCLSEAMRRFAGEQFALPTERLVMLMNGIDLERFDPATGARQRTEIRKEWHIGKEQRLALLVGNDWKRKGVAEAIEALARAQDPRVVLMIVGRGDLEAYGKLARRWNVAERVIFVGMVNDPRPYYGAADFVVLPSREDTCSLVVLEALVMGLPVVTTRQNGASDVIEDGRQGIILERGDAAGLAEAMRAMRDGERLGAMSRAALEMRAELSFDRHVERVEEVYKQVLAERGKTCIV